VKRISAAISQALRFASALLNVIEGPSSQSDRLVNLCRAIDGFVYAVGFLESPDVAPIERVDLTRVETDDLTIRKAISARFPELGHYWKALDMCMVSGVDGQLVVGDAIDDLLDITKALREVAWFEKHHGEDQALAALKFRYSSHLYMHVFPLRLYLEEVVRIG
jgi:hypothetical protein